MAKDELTALIHKYLSGEATEEEKLRLEEWYESFDSSSLTFGKGDPGEANESLVRSLAALKEKMARENSPVIKKIEPVKRISPIWYAAAILIIATAVGIFLSFWNKKVVSPVVGSIAVPSLNKDFQPGGNNAVLTLANGQKVVLDSTGTGLISRQGKTSIIKVNNGLLKYNGQQAGNNEQPNIQYNMITTPRGGKYEVILPDGSKVWLNAASSLRFPTAFTGVSREVQMTGEAYFEIARNASKPFIVKEENIEVKVLGTEFDVNAYADERDLKVTLVGGSVKVVSQNNSGLKKADQEQQAVLSSGQQVILSLSKDGTQKMNVVNDADINEAIAWKADLFWFDNDNIREVCRQLSRWYDIHITIEGNIPDLFTGSIPRNLTFSKVFEVLQKTGSIQYKVVSDKSIVVTP